MTIWQQWQRPRLEAYWGLLGFSMFYVIFEVLLISKIHNNISLWIKCAPVLVGLGYTLIGGGLLYRVLVHAKVTANEAGLVIANPFRSDQVLTWSDISFMKPDRLLMIHCHDGRTVVAWVIQKNGWSRLRNIRQNSDQAIEDMGALATRALGTSTIFVAT